MKIFLLIFYHSHSRSCRSEIVETTKRREMELCDVEEQLDIYRRLGSDFEAVATKYNDVRNDLEKQQWALNEIKKKLSKS